MNPINPKPRRSAGFLHWVALLMPLFLSGCFEEEKTGVSYMGVNHTDVAIIEVSPNGGRGGILVINAHGMSGDICCITIPSTWKPGLTTTIAWQDDSKVKKDANGKDVLNDGVPVLIPSPRKSKVVEIPRYDDPGNFWIHFFPNDEVKIVVSNYGPGHPKHGLPDSYIPGVTK